MIHSIDVNNQFKSSARISEENFDAVLFLDNFIAHGSILRVLENLSSEIIGSKQRAFTITGPYGAGKSTLALFLNCLLSTNQSIRSKASAKLSGFFSNDLFNNFAFNSSNGWAVVKHLCGLSAPVNSITHSILDSLNASDLSGSLTDEAACIEAIRLALDKEISKHDGVLIILDELGKALDYQSTQGGDLHFFQSLADLVQSYDNVIIVGFLHQSFSAYAKGRDSKTQNEWGKVQGRFKDYSFNPSIEESLHLIANSFNVGVDLQSKFVTQHQYTINLVSTFFKVSNSADLFKVLPLDPVVALLLGPISKRSFSQNERSLFSFIATHEQYGFRHFIANASEDKDILPLYRVNSLWDYLYHNLGHIITVSSDGKGWIEACDAVERSRIIGEDVHCFITQLVALLTLVGQPGKFFASKEFIIDYIVSIPDFECSMDEISEALRLLESKSIIIFRHNLNSYQVFRASDLDINRLVIEWIDRVKGSVDWTAACTSQNLILASSHYHQKGVMRWADTQVVSKLEDVREPTGVSGSPYVNFVVPVSRTLSSAAQQHFADNDYVVVADPVFIDQLEVVAIELIALQKLYKQEEEKLNRDPIARTEIENRIKSTFLNIDNALSSVLNKSKWVYKGQRVSGRSLSVLASNIADQIYFRCPPVQNELINRMKISGTSNSALNKLLLAILENDRDSDLGLPENTFPPEKGIYFSCLKSKGWHTPNSEHSFAGDWFNLVDSDSLNEEQRLAYELWKSGVDFIKNSDGLVVVKDLYDLWMKAPFGLTLGLSKLYAMALLKSMESNLAFYDFDSTKDWIYIPGLDQELVNKIWKHPHEAAVKFYELAATDLSLVKEVASASSDNPEESILGTARSLVQRIHALPSWVKRTSGNNLFRAGDADHLSHQAKRFRDRVLSAKDPYKLILEDIPSIFGDVNLAQSLKASIDSLQEIDLIVSNHFKSTIIDLLNSEPNEDLSLRAAEVVKNASRPEIENFAKRLQKWCGHSGFNHHFDELMALVIGVRKDSWTDEKISDGYDKLRNLCTQFKRYESFVAISSKASSSGMLPVALILQQASGEVIEYEQFIDQTSSGSNEILPVKDELLRSLEGLTNAQRVRVLTELLTTEMLPVGTEIE